jgi:hypothetical protein
MSMLVIVHGTWGWPAEVEPLVAPLGQPWSRAPQGARRAPDAPADVVLGVVTTSDTLMPSEAQRAMAATVGADVVEIDSGHSTFAERPARLAELLVAAAADRAFHSKQTEDPSP